MSAVGKGQTLPAGTVVGSFVVDALIAQGGMGAVYRVRNRVTGEARALKVVRQHLAGDAEFVQRFMREAVIASKLRHPGLVETLEPGIDGETVYLPMELLEGESLSQRLKRAGAFPPSEAVAILSAVCEAVQFLHDRRLLHRDLKPMNVYLANVGDALVPKVLDFGTARVLEDEEQTATGLIVGSPHYMAPEQAEGRKDLDARIDQYSLGVVAYQMLTGARPYESDDRESVLAKVLRGARFAPPHELRADLPPGLEAVVLRALSRDREQRFPSVRALGEALAQAVTGTAPVAAPVASAAMPVSSPEITPPPATHSAPPPLASATASRGRTGLIVGASIAAVVLVAGLVYGLWTQLGAAHDDVVAVSLSSAPNVVAPATVAPTAATTATVQLAPIAPAGATTSPTLALAAAPTPDDAGAPPARDAGSRARHRTDAGPRPHGHDRGGDGERCGPEYDRPCL